MYIIADEVYQLLYFDKKPDLPLYYYGGNVFSLSSFSKILAPSLRLGWIQCNDKLMNMLSRYHNNYTLTMKYHYQIVVVVIYDHIQIELIHIFM